MWPVTAQYLQAIRNDHAKILSAVHRDPITGTKTTLDVEDGSVTIDRTSHVRRTLSLSLPPSEVTWKALDTVGGEITLKRGLRYANGQIEWVPLGVFTVDTDQIDYSPGGAITIQSAPDRWGKVQKNTLPPSGRASVASNAAYQEIQRLVQGAWPGTTYSFPGWAKVDTSATSKVGFVLWDDGDRDAAITKLLTDNSLEAFFNPAGSAVLQVMPTLSSTASPVWTVDSGAVGVLLGADRTRDRTKAYNVIIASTSATDVTFTPQEVKNTTASDPLNVNGPLGYQALAYSSPTLRDSAQARAAATTLLKQYSGAAKQLNLTALHNDALDANDIIKVVLPRTEANQPRPTELHIIDTITLPLRPDGEMEIHTRSTEPDSIGS